MREKIIGKKVFIVSSDWTAFDGYYEEPKVFTTRTKARAELKRQAKEFQKNWDIPNEDMDFDDEGDWAFNNSSKIDSCSWSIFEKTIN